MVLDSASGTVPYIIIESSSHDGVISQKFICECGRQYKANKYLRQHQRWECGIEPSWECSFCAFKTKRKSSLTRHNMSHHY